MQVWCNKCLCSLKTTCQYMQNSKDLVLLSPLGDSQCSEKSMFILGVLLGFIFLLLLPLCHSVFWRIRKVSDMRKTFYSPMVLKNNLMQSCLIIEKYIQSSMLFHRMKEASRTLQMTCSVKTLSTHRLQ